MTEGGATGTWFELCAYHHSRAVAEVTEGLAVQPTLTIRAGDPSAIPELDPIPDNGWFYVGSYHGDSVHENGDLWWLLSHLEGRRDRLKFLLSVGWDIDVLLDMLPDDTKPHVSDALNTACKALGLSIAISPAYGLIGNPDDEHGG